MLIALFFSCGFHKEKVYERQIPPPKPEEHILKPESNLKDKSLFHPEIKLSQQRKIVSRHAIKSLGLPYKWGGQSPETGFDCSGLSTYIHKKAGIIIPRTVKAQFNKGLFVAKQNLLIGDLVFFKGPQKKTLKKSKSALHYQSSRFNLQWQKI